MDPATMDALLAELSADELAEVGQYLYLFVDSGTMPLVEADEWRIRAAAWAEYRCASLETAAN